MSNVSIKQINKSLKEASISKFYVTFGKVPGNEQDILSRQLISIGRPSIKFNADKRKYKGNHYREIVTYEYEPINAKFRIDDGGILTHCIMSQYYKQKVKDKDYKNDIYEKGGDFYPKITIDITTYDSHFQPNGGFTLHNAFITSISFGENLGFNTSEGDVLDVSFEYEGFDYKFVYDTDIPTI